MRAGWFGRVAVCGLLLLLGIALLGTAHGQAPADRKPPPPRNADPLPPQDLSPSRDLPADSTEKSPAKAKPEKSKAPPEKPKAPVAKPQEAKPQEAKPPAAEGKKPGGDPTAKPAKPPAARPAVNLPLQKALMAIFGVPPAAAPAAAPAVRMKRGLPEAEAVRENVLVPADRALLLLLSKAKQLSQQKRYAEAVRSLGAILESPEDYFYRPQRNSKVLPSLKSEAERLLGTMPREARELYEVQFGARARQLLSTAIASGNPSDLAEVSRRFFHTRAGNEATLLLGFYHLDCGSPMAAARSLQRLRDSAFDVSRFEPELSMALASCWQISGASGTAKSILEKVQSQYGDKLVGVGGREVALTVALAQISALPRLAGTVADASGAWLMFRGNAARNGVSRSGGPLLSIAWQVPTTDRPEIDAVLEQIQDAFRERDQWAIPSLHPLVVGDIVLMRTARNLLAVDGLSGKRVWEVPGDDPFEPQADPNAEQAQMYSSAPADRHALLRIRMWGDATYGTLSSDGRLVFAVEDLSLDVHNRASQIMFSNRAPSPNDPKGYNRLAAYDVRTGKLIWHAGGSPEQYRHTATGAFFLGAPLPLAGQLYVLGETRGEIRLYALAAKTGKLLWSQPLATIEQERETLVDPLRRVSGVSPSFADGVLICPTSNRSVVAVDLATRALLWGYTYTSGAGVNQAPGAPMFFNPGMSSDPDPAVRWANASITLADGLALITPTDSGEIHCLRLLDGALQWQKPRQQDLYLACVHRGNVVLVGRRAMRALRLSDGQPAWDGRQVEFDAAASPAGYGFLCDDLYYLPLSSAEVAAVDVVGGRVVRRYASRRGIVPGNLTVYKDKILSQRAASLDAFHQLDSLKTRVQERLAAQPNDSVALLHRGEMLWNDGKLDDAIASLRRSFEQAPNPGARNLLREAMLDGLANDFPRFKDRREEIRRLADEPKHLSTFQRLMAVGQRQSGDYRAALESYVQYIDMDFERRELDRIEKTRSVRRDRWASLELTALSQSATPETRADLAKIVAGRSEAALRDGTVEAVQKFLGFFGELSDTTPARRLLAQKFRQSQRFVQAELLLRGIERLGEKPQAAAAAAETAALLKQAGSAEDAAGAYRRVAERYGDVVCSGGKTGKQLLAELDPKDPVAVALKPDVDWPRKMILVERQTQKTVQQPAYGVFAVPMVGPRSDYAAETVVEIQQHPQSLMARDGWGNVRWQIKSPEWMRQNAGVSPYSWRAATRDHLLVVSMGAKLVAIDTLGKDGSAAQTLWVRDLEETSRSGKRVPKTGPRGMGMQAFQPIGPVGQLPANMPVIVSEGLLCAQRQRSVYGIDLLSGDVLWMRDDIYSDSALFGDDRCLVVAPPDSRTAAMLLRPSDGSLIAKRDLPANRLMAVGHNLIVWQNVGDKVQLECLDPLDRKTLWKSRPFACMLPMCVSLVQGRYIGIVEQSGRFTLLAAADGKPLIDAPIRPEAVFSDIHVLRYPDSFLLIVNGIPRPNRQPPQLFNVFGMSNIQIQRAHFYGFDASGQKLWDGPTVVEDQFLMQNQPARLPLLIFACGVQEKGLNGTQARTALLGLDRRTGRLVRPTDLFEGYSYFRLVGNVQTRSVEVQLQRELIAFKFTDTAPPPPTTAAGILGAVKRASGMTPQGQLPFDNAPPRRPDNLLPGLSLPDWLPWSLPRLPARPPGRKRADAAKPVPVDGPAVKPAAAPKKDDLKKDDLKKDDLKKEGDGAKQKENPSEVPGSGGAPGAKKDAATSELGAALGKAFLPLFMPPPLGMPMHAPLESLPDVEEEVPLVPPDTEDVR